VIFIIDDAFKFVMPYAERIWASIEVEALASSGRLTHPAPAIPARIKTPAAIAMNVVLRIWFSPSSDMNLDGNPTGLQYHADVIRHQFGIVCIELAD
jgi:hypothetical protein